MNIGIQWKIISVVFLLCLVTACSFRSPVQIPAKRTYVLQGEPGAITGNTSVAGSCASIRISVPESAPGYRTSRMAYTETPRHIEYFSYHEWIDTPAKMIAAAVESRLDELGMFGAVLSGSPDVRTDFRLDSEVQSLRQEFSANTSQVNLAIKVSLVDLSGRTLLSSQTFAYREASDGANPEAGVAAANRAVERFLIDLVAFLGDSTESAECPRQN